MAGEKEAPFYHAVWVTKFRRPLLDEDLRPRLHEYLYYKIGEYGGKALAVGGTVDHVHLVFTPPPGVMLAPFVGRLKGSSSHWVNHFYRPGGDFAWQRGYGLCPVPGEEAARLVDYLRRQDEDHRQGTTVPAYEEVTRKIFSADKR